MKKKKVIKRIVGVVIFALIVTLITIYIMSNTFRYNEEGQTANTTGNLYNEGLFCEYKGYVYFANAADDNSLYRMKTDGTKLEKLHSDSVSYIQVVNDYIYYVRFNKTSADVVLRGQPFGIFRLEIGDDRAQAVYDGLVKSMCICGNYIYFQAYDDENFIQLKKVKIDGEELVTLSDNDYIPLAVWNNEIYFPGVDGDYNLKRLEVETDRIGTVVEGNYYMPAFVEGYMYYIDLDNDMKLTRVSLSTNNTEILDEGRCINYNISEENNLIYYQLENEDDRRLCRMSPDGQNKVTVTEGNCSNIHITKKYTYFYMLSGIGAEIKTLYRVDNSGNSIQAVNFE